MIVEKVKVSEFDRISIQHEYFLWNFLPDEMGCVSMRSFFQEAHPCTGVHVNPIEEILKVFDIPYFESRLEDSIDFVINSGIFFPSKLWVEGRLSPVIIGFKRKRKVSSTLDGICHCPEGVIEIIYKMNPNFITNINLDEL